MRRKLVVNALAALVVVLVGGSAFAQNGLRVDMSTEDLPKLGEVEEALVTDEPIVPVDAAAVEDEDAGGDAAEPRRALVPVEGSDVEEVEEGEGFGAIRSAEVRAFGACMAASGGDAEARADCQAHRPGPAHHHPAHPNHGKPGGPPEHAGRPEHAGPPDHAGRPDHAGPPDRAGAEPDPGAEG